MTPRTLSTVFTSWSPLQASPELQIVFAEAQLYTDGSIITGPRGHFLKGNEVTKSTGAVIGTDDGDTYTATRLDLVASKLTQFLTEITTSVFARLRSRSDIASDFQGSIKTLPKAPPISAGAYRGLLG